MPPSVLLKPLKKAFSKTFILALGGLLTIKSILYILVWSIIKKCRYVNQSEVSSKSFDSDSFCANFFIFNFFLNEYVLESKPFVNALASFCKYNPIADRPSKLSQIYYLRCLNHDNFSFIIEAF